jgi:hypothetical protein
MSIIAAAEATAGVLALVQNVKEVGELLGEGYESVKRSVIDHLAAQRNKRVTVLLALEVSGASLYVVNSAGFTDNVIKCIRAKPMSDDDRECAWSAWLSSSSVVRMRDSVWATVSGCLSGQWAQVLNVGGYSTSGCVNSLYSVMEGKAYEVETYELGVERDGVGERLLGTGAKLWSCLSKQQSQALYNSRTRSPRNSELPAIGQIVMLCTLEYKGFVVFAISDRECLMYDSAGETYTCSWREPAVQASESPATSVEQDSGMNSNM